MMGKLTVKYYKPNDYIIITNDYIIISNISDFVRF